MIKKGLLVFFVIFLFSSKVYGSFNDIESFSAPKLYLFQNNNLEGEDEGGGISIFLFSNVTYPGEGNGGIYLFFSNIGIESEIQGNIYSFFSKVNVGRSWVKNKIFTLSSSVSFPRGVETYPLIESIDFLVNINEQNGSYFYSDEIPRFIIYGLLIFTKVFICLIFMALRKGFFMQGTMTVIYNKTDIYKNGIMAYIIFWVLIIVFVLSTLGAPIAFLIALVFYASFIAGQVSFSLFLGNAILSNTNKRFPIATKLILGVILLEAISFLPYVCYILKIFICPLLYSGIFFTAASNVYVEKVFYNIPFVSDNTLRYFNKQKIKDIILDGIENQNK
ncbi:MAG: hypothetical protein LBV08_01805 [Clostridiales bacterium]|jgi:hypothetical protein|nr:hypothetical protein [Clostridiales bacterium]